MAETAGGGGDGMGVTGPGPARPEQVAPGPAAAQRLMAVDQTPPSDGRERDFAREMVQRVRTDADAKQPKSEPEILRGIEQRAELYESAYLKAKQPALDALPKDADFSQRLTELRKRDVEPVPAETVRQWAAVDARDFVNLRAPSLEESAAVQLAENARANSTYKAALAEQSSGVQQRVTALDRLNTAKVDLKEIRKREELASMDQDKASAAQQWPAVKAAMQAVADIDAFGRQKNETEQHFVRHDIAIAARNSRAYRETLQTLDPGLAKAVETQQRPAFDLDTSAAANDPKIGAAMSIDRQTMDRLAANRARDRNQVTGDLGLNSVGPTADSQTRIESEAQSKRAAVAEPKRLDQTKPAQPLASGANQVESDEIFTATKHDARPIVPPEVEAKYLRVGDKFYNPRNPEVVAFEDKGNKLETRSNSEQVAETMVLIAKSRGWDEIKVSGSETFRKEVWLEAAANGMQVKGYTPTDLDKAQLAMRTHDADTKAEPEVKQHFRGRESADQPVGTGSDDRIMKEIERRGIELEKRGAAAIAEAARLDAKAVGQIANDENRASALTMIGWQADRSKQYRAELQRVDPKIARLADSLQAAELDGAFGGAQAAAGEEDRKALMADVRAVAQQRPIEHQRAGDVQSRSRAQVFAERAPAEAVKEHPELVGAYAAVASIDKKATTDQLSPQQHAVVMARVRQNLVNSIERGETVDVRLREQVEVRRAPREDREVTR